MIRSKTFQKGKVADGQLGCRIELKNQKTKWMKCSSLVHGGKLWVARTDARSGISSPTEKKVHQEYKPISPPHCCFYPPVHPASFPLQFLSTFCSPLKEIGYKLWHELALRLTDTAAPKGRRVKKLSPFPSSSSMASFFTLLLFHHFQLCPVLPRWLLVSHLSARCHLSLQSWQAAASGFWRSNLLRIYKMLGIKDGSWLVWEWLY